MVVCKIGSPSSSSLRCTSRRRSGSNIKYKKRVCFLPFVSVIEHCNSSNVAASAIENQSTIVRVLIGGRKTRFISYVVRGESAGDGATADTVINVAVDSGAGRKPDTRTADTLAAINLGLAHPEMVQVADTHQEVQFSLAQSEAATARVCTRARDRSAERGKAKSTSRRVLLSQTALENWEALKDSLLDAPFRGHIA